MRGATASAGPTYPSLDQTVAWPGVGLTRLGPTAAAPASGAGTILRGGGKSAGVSHATNECRKKTKIWYYRNQRVDKLS